MLLKASWQGYSQRGLGRRHSSKRRVGETMGLEWGPASQWVANRLQALVGLAWLPELPDVTISIP